jgi:hypothetical protein
MQVLSDLPPRCIIISCHTCVFSVIISSVLVSFLADYPAVVPSSAMDLCSLPTAMYVQRPVLCSTADARRLIASHLERYGCPRCLDCGLGSRAPVYRAQGHARHCLRRVTSFYQALTLLNDPCEIRGSPARFCSALPQHGRQTNSWHGIADTCSSAT